MYKEARIFVALHISDVVMCRYPHLFAGGGRGAAPGAAGVPALAAAAAHQPARAVLVPSAAALAWNSDDGEHPTYIMWPHAAIDITYRYL